ncbi:serine/threonine protein kinase [Colletotrichum tofieldiae]|nr:serine/threonine protein kinase [Colletotrichum tofieldiae]
MYSSNGGSTQSFSDSAELQRRIKRTEAEHRRNSPLAGRVRPWQSKPAKSVAEGTQRKDEPTTHTTVESSTLSTPGNLELAELIKAFTNASLASLPDARLILASPRRPADADSAIVPLPHNVGGWDMVGIVQRTQDVNFTLCIPYYDSPCETVATRLIPMQLQCSIYYNPANDDCVLINKSYTDIYLTCLSSPTTRKRLSCDQTRVIRPGMWRISVEVDNDSVQLHLVDFLMLRRQFTVTLHEGLAGSSTSIKRLASGLASDDKQIAIKRRRREGDVTEILLATTANSTRKAPDALVAGAAKTLDPAVTASLKLIRAGGTPLLDLSDGGVAVVRTIQSRDETTCSTPTRAPTGVSCASNTTTYRLNRLERIADTLSASVFTGRHSALSEKVVAKVIRYRGKTAEDLIKCATIWKREKSVLEKLHHAFDGRIFVMLVEHLPPSLHRGLNSPFKPTDAHTILRGTSSALAYLAGQRIIHNDIKPANIAYSPVRGPVLLDFGLATTANEKGLPGGTPWYIPPDLVVQRTRGTPGDVWALGVTMLYVLGKITLPERTTRGWLIRDVMTRDEEAREYLMIWLDIVARAREKLGRADRVEDHVFHMLEPGSNSRIKAAKIAAAFEDVAKAATETCSR